MATFHFSPHLHQHTEAKTAGFSLLEMIIVIGLLTAVLLGTLILIVPIARQSRINREIEIANAEAQKALEQFQATPFHDIVDDFPPGTELIIDELTDATVTINYADPTADPLLIQVNLSWTSPDLGDMQRVFDTVRTE